MQVTKLGNFNPASLLPAAMSLLGPGGGGSSSPMPGMPGESSPITVSPTIATQVSPQISPVFQQQFQPSNSGMTAGTSQYIPTTMAQPGTAATVPMGMPSAGGGLPISMPGDMGLPGMPSSFSPIATSGGALPGTILGVKSEYVILGGAALVALVILMRKKTATENGALK